MDKATITPAEIESKGRMLVDTYIARAAEASKDWQHGWNRLAEELVEAGLENDDAAASAMSMVMHYLQQQLLLNGLS